MHLLKVTSVEIVFNMTFKIDILNPAESHLIFTSLACRGPLAWEPVSISMDNSLFPLSQSYALNPVCGKVVKLTDSSVLLWLLLG